MMEVHESPQAYIFDRRARTFDRLRWVTNSEFHGQIVSVIAGIVEDMKANGHQVRRFLDVGTGTGEVIRYLKSAFPELLTASGVGIDVSREMLGIAKEKLQGLQDTTFERASITQFQDDLGFDLIVCRNAFHHFDELELAVEHMKNLVTDTGRILIIEGIAPDAYCLAQWRDVLKKRDPGRNKDVYLSADDVQQKFEGWFGCSVRVHKLEPVMMTLNNWLRNALIMPHEVAKIVQIVKRLHKNDRHFRRKFRLTKYKDDFRFVKLSVLLEIRPDRPIGS